MTKHISWDEYFMGVALLSSYRSKDPSTKVGACIVNNDKKIIGIGYNGFPIGVSDETFPWTRDSKEFLDNKYPYVVHAEPNAILNSTSNLKGATMYVTLFPCNECAKLIIQAGIKHIIYLEDKYPDSLSNEASRRMFDSANVTYEQMENITIKFGGYND